MWSTVVTPDVGSIKLAERLQVKVQGGLQADMRTVRTDHKTQHVHVLQKLVCTLPSKNQPYSHLICQLAPLQT